MAESSQQLYNRMNKIEQRLSGYNLGAAPGQARAELGKAVNNFQPQYQELGQAEAKSYRLPGDIMAQYNRRRDAGEFAAPGIQGTQFTGVNPLEALNYGIGQVGDQNALVDTIGRGIDFQRGRLEDILGDITQQYQLGYNQTLDKYGRIKDLYGLALQQEEARKARAAASRAAAMQNQMFQRAQGGGGMMGGLEEDIIETQDKKNTGWLDRVMNKSGIAAGASLPFTALGEFTGAMPKGTFENAYRQYAQSPLINPLYKKATSIFGRKGGAGSGM